MTLAASGETARADPQGDRASGRGYAGYVLRKVAGAFGSLLFVVVLTFFLFRVLPGDPARSLGRGRFTTPEQLEAFNKTYGLEEPLPQQFLTFLKNTFTGDLGISLKFHVPVSDLILDRMWPTLLLVGTSTLLATVCRRMDGHPGCLEARAAASTRRRRCPSLVLYSMPEWWLGLLLIAALAVGIGPLPGLFPTGGLHSVGRRPLVVQGVFDTAWHLVLPVVTLALAYLADYALIMRSSLLDELGEDYLTTARAKGLRDVQVRNRHAVPNALLPTTTLIAINFGFVVGGAITIETIFSIPGLGLLSYEALSVPDLWVLQGTFLVAAGGVIFANLCANLLYGLLDPRVRT